MTWDSCGQRDPSLRSEPTFLPKRSYVKIPVSTHLPNFDAILIFVPPVARKQLRSTEVISGVMNIRGRSDNGPGFVGIKFCQEW